MKPQKPRISERIAMDTNVDTPKKQENACLSQLARKSSRIEELEAQVETLTKFLHAKGFGLRDLDPTASEDSFYCLICKSWFDGGCLLHGQEQHLKGRWSASIRADKCRCELCDGTADECCCCEDGTCNRPECHN